MVVLPAPLGPRKPSTVPTRTCAVNDSTATTSLRSIAEALESLEAWRPDVLVSDGGASERASYLLFGKSHALDTDRGGRIPALALTSLGRADPRLGRLIAQVKRDVPKPVEPAVLTAEIARLAGREQRRAQR